MARITVKVHPRAKRTRVTGKLGEAYKLDLAAPPIDGKANAECVRFLAELAGVSRSQVKIVIGLTTPCKIITIEGISQEELEGRLTA